MNVRQKVTDNHNITEVQQKMVPSNETYMSGSICLFLLYCPVLYLHLLVSCVSPLTDCCSQGRIGKEGHIPVLIAIF